MNYFDLKKYIDELLYKAFNFYSDATFALHFKTKKLLKTNSKYENIHKNERCFIVGTGPSINFLKDDEIQKLETENVFAVNSFFKIDRLKNITPKYYVLVDDVFWRNTWQFGIEDVRKKYSDSMKIITDYRAEKLINSSKSKNNTIFLYCKKYPVNHIKANLTSNMHVGINVVSYAILCAMYMGFKEIYLLGCDYNSFATEKDEHSYDDADEQYEIEDRLAMLLSFYARATEIHYLIQAFAKKEDVKIINLTNGSLLDAYPKNSISKVL